MCWSKLLWGWRTWYHLVILKRKLSGFSSEHMKPYFTNKISAIGTGGSVLRHQLRCVNLPQYLAPLPYFRPWTTVTTLEVLEFLLLMWETWIKFLILGSDVSSLCMHLVRELTLSFCLSLKYSTWICPAYNMCVYVYIHMYVFIRIYLISIYVD